MWEPIETASSMAREEDPPRILVWVADGGAEPGQGAMAFGHAYKRTNSVVIRADGYHGAWKYTHWMPLPPPPES